VANYFKPGGRQTDARASQKTPSFDIADGTREQNDPFPDVVMRIEPTAIEFPDVIGGSQIDTNSISCAYWPGALDRGSQIDTNSAEWLQSSIDKNGATLSWPLLLAGGTSQMIAVKDV
jgi:hypothetical protein